MILSQLPPEITGLFTEKTLVWATAGWLLIQNLGRAYHAIASHGGIHGIWKALVFGTNVPTVKEVIAESKRQEDVAITKNNPPADTQAATTVNES